MAAIYPPSSSHYKPQARYGHCSAFVNGKIFMHGGCIIGTRDTQPPTVVDVFNPAAEEWDQVTTTGPPPPGFISASCAVIGIYLYIFGGRDGMKFFNNINQLDTQSLTWSKLDDANQRESPVIKAGAAMISYNERILVTIGGYGILPYHRRSGTEYILDPDLPVHGWTNELLCFNVVSRTWSSPHTTGTPPPASAGHSFTMVDLHRAVLFGGKQQRHLFPNHVYILDVQMWMWTTITGGGPSWPVARAGHSAVSLHHPSDLIPDPALMVMWGLDDSMILNDSWVFQVNVQQWSKFTLPDTLKGRCTHTTTVVHTSSTHKKLITYGGLDELPMNPRDYSSYIPVAETTVLNVEQLPSGEEFEPIAADIKPKLEPVSLEDEKPTLSEFKTEPASPNWKDGKPNQVKPFSDIGHGDDLVLKENAFLRELVAHQKEQIMEIKWLCDKSLQEGQTLPTSEQAVQIAGDSTPHVRTTEGQTLPTSEQAVQTARDNTPHVRTTEYLRGFESFAETRFVTTGIHSQSFEWQGYGLKLHIPQGAVPAEHTECRIDIKVGLCGQFSFPDDSQLVSCVYWVSCSQKFLTSVTLDIEHCAAVQDSSQSSSLCFVAAKCSQTDLPYQFKELKQTTFSPRSSFGSVQVSQFSIFGIIAYKMCWWLRRYSANVYYIKRSINEWRLNFVITWNLSGFDKVVESVFAGHASDDHLSMAVEFQEDTITLEVPVDGEVLENGWEITPLTPPTIMKSQVDSFRPGQQLPSCCLSIEWTGEDSPVKLKRRISLVGAKKPFDFFCIKLIPEIPLTITEDLGKDSQKRRRKQVEDNHSVKLKREKLSNESEIQTDKKSLDVRTLTHELKGVSEWFQLGGQLGVSHDKLKQIEQDCSRETERCKSEMLNCWLQGDQEASWIKVVEALQRMDRAVLAQQLRREYMCLPSGDMPEVFSPSSSSDAGIPKVEELDEDNQLRPPLPSESHPAPPKDPLQ